MISNAPVGVASRSGIFYFVVNVVCLVQTLNPPVVLGVEVVMCVFFLRVGAFAVV